MENSQLHDDLLIEFFSRLPAKSVGKFRCLSKAWYAHLSTSQFINLHLSTTRKNNQSQLFLENCGSSFYVWTPRNDDPVATTKIDLPFTTWSRVVNSCNGLVLLANRQLFFLVNPITQQHVQVPNPMLCSTCFGFGLGYDSCSDDYKIVIYNSCGVDTSILDVYSVKSKVWKRVSSSTKHPIDKGGYEGVFTNEAIHWIAISRGTCIIVAFNMVDEVFYYLPIPASARNPCLRVYILEGCLCVIDTPGNLKTDIWLMKEYGVHDSWTRFTVNKWINDWGLYRPLCFIGDEKIVFITYSRRVVVCDLVDGTAKHHATTDGVAFSESLVSLSSDQHVISS